MRIYVMPLCFTLFFVSCQNQQPPLPAEQMVNILSDMHMAETFSRIVSVNTGVYDVKNKDTLQKLYSSIYQFYKMDTTQFSAALLWYQQHPKEFDKVYVKVLEELSIRKESFQDSLVEYSDSTLGINNDTL
jgi:hypothetical protein